MYKQIEYVQRGQLPDNLINLTLPVLGLTVFESKKDHDLVNSGLVFPDSDSEPPQEQNLNERTLRSNLICQPLIFLFFCYFIMGPLLSYLQCHFSETLRNLRVP